METPFLGSKLVSHTGEVNTSDVLSAPVLAIYFSAHWCPPCRGFTPTLAKHYNKWNEKEKKIEVIFVRSDRDQSGFDEYFKSMPWVAVPFSATETRAALKAKYTVKGIPMLVIVDKSGKCLKLDGRDDVEDNGEAALELFQTLN